MRFRADGPEIPNALLQAHEEGRVVFFCGAGISCPAGLPGFRGLVDMIYDRLGTPRLPLERRAYDENRYDQALGHLEERYPGGRGAVRKALMAALQPKLDAESALETHVALLSLARDRDGQVRLVTTNFDRIFEHVAQLGQRPLRAYAAPLLPIPRKSSWDGLVYLHGLLPAEEDEAALGQLVVTSGDFGLAYLVERWAARFASELFRNYVVCFVGYSLDDPVLRYMMDALAVLRALGESTPSAYALAGWTPGNVTQADQETAWRAKGVSPILYVASDNRHSALHATLKIWANTYRPGVPGKEQIVVADASRPPTESTVEEGFVERVLWALSDVSGLPAKRFAELDPVPVLEWLTHASMLCGAERSGLARPQSSRGAVAVAGRMRLAGRSFWPELDSVARGLCLWMVRHLGDPRLLLWVSGQGGEVHPEFAWYIEQRLEELARLEREGKTEELRAIQAQASNAIPQPLLRKLWGVVLCGRLKGSGPGMDMFRWSRRFERDGLTAPIRIELREMLAPKIAIRPRYPWSRMRPRDAGNAPIENVPEIELVLTARDVRSSLPNLAGERWASALPALVDDLQQLLRDGLELLRELGHADEREDPSVWLLPSISPHRQNEDASGWLILIELLRDAWLALRRASIDRAVLVATSWFREPFPAFKRLALYAAGLEKRILPDQWVDWLLDPAGLCLWSVSTRRETLRLLRLRGRDLSGLAQEAVEAAILAGPPSRTEQPSIDPELLRVEEERSVWLRLEVLRGSGLELGAAAVKRLADFSAAHPAWKLAGDERDQFVTWLSGTDGLDEEDDAAGGREVAPLRRSDLVAWLRRPPTGQTRELLDNWPDVCRTRFPRSLVALCQLAREGTWPEERWRDAFYAWSSDALARRSWRRAAPLVREMPEGVFRNVLGGLMWWVEKASRSVDSHQAALLEICGRVLDVEAQSGMGVAPAAGLGGDPVGEAINHPVGHVAEAVLNMWFRNELHDGDKLPADVEAVATRLCGARLGSFRHGRVVLCSQLNVLFRVDQTWTEEHLLPLFDWNVNPQEARGAWEGFLWRARLHLPLIVALKPDLLGTVDHYAALGERGPHFVAFLTHAALAFPAASDPLGFTGEELREAVGRLPPAALVDVARALVRGMAGSGNQREDYWSSRVQPFWHNVWPKSADYRCEALSEELARLCLAAGDQFPAALEATRHWLMPTRNPEHATDRLSESGFCSKFPKEALRFLGALVDDQPWGARGLRKCLDTLVDAEPELAEDPVHQRLRVYSRQHYQ